MSIFGFFGYAFLKNLFLPTLGVRSKFPIILFVLSPISTLTYFFVILYTFQIHVFGLCHPVWDSIKRTSFDINYKLIICSNVGRYFISIKIILLSQEEENISTGNWKTSVHKYNKLPHKSNIGIRIISHLMTNIISDFIQSSLWYHTATLPHKTKLELPIHFNSCCGTNVLSSLSVNVSVSSFCTTLECRIYCQW